MSAVLFGKIGDDDTHLSLEEQKPFVDGQAQTLAGLVKSLLALLIELLSHMAE